MSCFARGDAKDIFPLALKKGFKIFGYSSSEYIKDMGTPKRLGVVVEDLSSNKVNKKNYIN